MSSANTHSTSPQAVAVVDFGPFLDGSGVQGVAEKILHAFKEIGFVYLINHGLDRGKINGMFEMSRKFFSMPSEKKLLAPHPANGSHHRGYSAPGVEKVAKFDTAGEEIQEAIRSKAPDFKESFEVGREEDQLMPNIWLPDGVLPEFKETCLDFFWECNKTKFKVMSALAVGLGLPANYFDGYHQKPDNQLRLLHYPSVPTESLKKEEVTRINAHTDFCSMTLLLQDDVGGLEVENPKRPGEFLPVTPVKDGLVVNAGDFMMRWSNDLIKSTVHRVRAPPGQLGAVTPDRCSIVYFCATDFETVVECLPGTYSEENPKKYKPISALNYIMERLAANY